MTYAQVNTYILDAIDNSGYNSAKLETDKDKLQFLHGTFMAEYGWRVKQAGMYRAVSDWLSGLPSSCNIEWRNHAIIELATKWGYLPENASDECVNSYLQKWFPYMARRIISLWNKHNIA